MHCEDVDLLDQWQWNLFGHVEWFYDELAGEDDDTESDEDYFDDTYANRRKRRGGATPTAPGSRGGRTRKSQPDDTPAKRGRALAGPTGSLHCWCQACYSTWRSTGDNLKALLASVLVLIGIWWFVRTALSLLINLVCPLLVVILAVLCVPQLRRPLIDNYPLLANVPRNILLKLADNIKY